MTHSEPLTNIITKLLLTHTVRLGGLLDFQAMFICSCCKHNLALRISQARKTRENICKEERVKMAYVRG